MKNQITKYYIGLGVIALLVIGLAIYTITLGSASKKDAQTEKKANEIAEKLNSYIRTNYKIPESLSEVGVTDVPSTITYTKNSDGTTYEFCITYETATDYGVDPYSLLYGSALEGAKNYDNDVYRSSYQPESLYIGYYHNKGKDCQTIKPYLYNYNDYKYLTPGTSSSPNITGTVQSKARDTERQTDMKALQSHLEVYFAQEGFYPTLANMQDTSWVATNLKGLDKESLHDPSGTSYKLSATATKNVYGYEVKDDNGKTCSNTAGKECTDYTLSAILESGTTYTLKSLN